MIETAETLFARFVLYRDPIDAVYILKAGVLFYIRIRVLTIRAGEGEQINGVGRIRGER